MTDERTDISRWQTLPEVWQLAFVEAISAYITHGSAPIGSVVVDSEGILVSRGHNNVARQRLAHAEMNALTGIPEDANRPDLAIYSTLEPCPMCTGAIRIFQLGAVHFAARDPGAGSTELLRATDFMRAFPCAISVPRIRSLERVVVALLTEHRERTGHHRWRDRWHRYQPMAFKLGCALASDEAHSRWVRSNASARDVFEEVASKLAALAV